MLRLDRRGPDESWVTEWTGDVPIRCRTQESYPLQLDIGTPVEYEILYVRPGTPPMLRLRTIFDPLNLKVERTQSSDFHFVAWFREKSSEVDSADVGIEVDWDGQWESGEKEMHKHLTIKTIKPPSN